MRRPVQNKENQLLKALHDLNLSNPSTSKTTSPTTSSPILLRAPRHSASSGEKTTEEPTAFPRDPMA